VREREHSGPLPPSLPVPFISYRLLHASSESCADLVCEVVVVVVLQVVFRGESRGRRGGRKTTHVVEPGCRKEGGREGRMSRA